MMSIGKALEKIAYATEGCYFETVEEAAKNVIRGTGLKILGYGGSRIALRSKINGLVYKLEYDYSGDNETELEVYADASEYERRFLLPCDDYYGCVVMPFSRPIEQSNKRFNRNRYNEAFDVVQSLLEPRNRISDSSRENIDHRYRVIDYAGC